MIALQESTPELSVLPLLASLNLESTLQELSLYEFQIESEYPGREVAHMFEANPLLPGVVLTEEGTFLGMISRRRFLEYMSRPYGLELFSTRPIKCLYLLAQTDALIVPGTTSIVSAARQSLQRPTRVLYEPIIVEIEPQIYKLLDFQQLMIAQSHIQELTTQLLNEQTQARMLQTEKMVSLGQMVAEIAHEILNPVNFISGNLDYLSRYNQDLIKLIAAYDTEIAKTPPIVAEIKEDIDFTFLREDLFQILNSMKLGTERLVKIINGLRNFSHMDEGNRRPVDLHDCIDSTLLILNNRIKYNIELVKNYGQLPLIPGYSGQLSQVFMNIINNAVDALMDKLSRHSSRTWEARIEIATEVIEAEDVRWAVVRIADNGSGIPPEIQGRIFETFFTTKPVGKGTGLGLAISHQIVTEKHKGQLKVQSQPECGTEFEILLPLV